ncbi:hypothetical protein H4582DRAFT_495864 [Lactarius indigo]|nr:hypothetical protein H4582DRAFT_495864 [Lactarius indigo]
MFSCGASCLARASQTMRKQSNGPGHASIRRQPRERHARGTNWARRSSCTCCNLRSRTTGPVLAAWDPVGRRQRRRPDRLYLWGTTRTTKRERKTSLSPSLRPKPPSTRRWLQHSPTTNPNMMTSRSPSVVTCTRRLVKGTRAETSSDSASVEVVISLPTKHARTHTRTQAVSPRRMGKHHPHTPTSPCRKRRRVADEREQDDSDDSEIEITVDTPRELHRVSKAKLQSQLPARPPSRHKLRHSAQQHCTSNPPAIHMCIRPRPCRPRPRRNSHR